MGTLLNQQGNIADAIFHYQQAITLYPKFAKAHNNLGSALAGQGKLKEAIEYFENAININPNYVDASNNLEIARSLLK